jgi:hypothetical protein
MLEPAEWTWGRHSCGRCLHRTRRVS